MVGRFFGRGAAMTTEQDVKPRKAAPPVVRIFENAVYTLDSAQKTLHLTDTSLRREIRLRRIRVAKRSGKYYFLGKWLLEWIEDGEVANDDAVAK
jgi:hypothetical protein